jgi:hypothetical protein
MEAGVIALAGILLGVLGGIAYTQTALHGLSAVWSGATQGLELVFSASFGTLFNAALATLVVVLLTLFWASRKMFKVETRDLLSGSWSDDLSPLAVRKNSKLMLILAVLAVLLLGAGFFMKNPEAVAGMFFGSGMLLMIAGLLWLRGWMQRDSGALARSLWQIGSRNISRRPSRSLAVIGMMAGGIFLVVAVNAFRMSAGDDTLRTELIGGRNELLVGDAFDLKRSGGVAELGGEILPGGVVEGDAADDFASRAKQPGAGEHEQQRVMHAVEAVNHVCAMQRRVMTEDETERGGHAAGGAALLAVVVAFELLVVFKPCADQRLGAKRHGCRIEKTARPVAPVAQGVGSEDDKLGAISHAAVRSDGTACLERG